MVDTKKAEVTVIAPSLHTNPTLDSGRQRRTSGHFTGVLGNLHRSESLLGNVVDPDKERKEVCEIRD